MKIFILQPTGRHSYLLFDAMEETFRGLGHSFVQHPADCDVCFFDFWNHGGVYCKRDVDAVMYWKKPVAIFDFKDQWGSKEHRPNWWGFDGFKILYQCADFDEDWAKVTVRFLEAGIIKMSFTRKMSSSWPYFPWVRPIEVALYPDHDFQVAEKDTFLNRPNDICFIGNATPWRANAATSLSKSRVKCDFFFPFHRLAHEPWLERHRQSKLFMEADGGGYGSERPYQLGTISAMLKIKNDQLQPFPWTDGINCIEVGDQWGVVTPDECEEVQRKVSDPDYIYHIYLNGVDHLRKHYSSEARAEYVLEQIESVDIR